MFVLLPLLGTLAIAGTPSSSGYLEDGDVIELEVESLGILTTRLIKPADWRDRESPDKN